MKVLLQSKGSANFYHSSTKYTDHTKKNESKSLSIADSYYLNPSSTE